MDALGTASLRRNGRATRSLGRHIARPPTLGPAPARSPFGHGDADSNWSRGLRPGSLAPVQKLLAPLLVILLGLAAWAGGTLRPGFSYDDREMLSSPLVTGSRPWVDAARTDAWEHRGNAGHWRPMAIWSLRSDLSRHGLNAAAFARTNVALHLLVLALGCLCLRALTRRGGLATGSFREDAWLAGLLGLAVFAVHPALADSVAWISGRTSMLCAAGGLVGLVGVALATTHRPKPAAAGASAALGLLLALAGKEDGLAFAPLYLMAAARGGRRTLMAVAFGAGIAAAAWLALRLDALGAFLQPRHEAPLGSAPLLERCTVGTRAFLELVRTAVLPLDYPPAWRANALRPAGPAGYARATAGAVLFVGLAAAFGGTLLRARTPRSNGPAARREPGQSAAAGTVAAAGGLGALAALVPVLQLVPLGEIAAPRFLYLPLLFCAPLVGLALQRIFPGRWSALAILPLLTLLFLCQGRAAIYASRLSYWEARLPHEPTSPQVWNALGNSHLERNDRSRAKAAFERATELDPAYSRPWTGLAILALDAGDDLAAEEHLMRAVETGPRNPIAWANAGALWLRAEAYGAAAYALERSAALAPARAPTWRALARARRALGDHAAADEAQARASELDPR